jgi:hypothetical protein
LDAVAISGIDPEQLAQDFVDSGTVNETEGWVSGFDPTILQNAQTQAQDALQQYIQDNLPDATVGDVIGGAKTIVQEFPVLPSSLPNRIVTTGARYGQLPTQLQHQISYAFEKDILGDPIDPITFAWPEINNQKITLSFKPATPEDEEAMQSLLPDGEITDISQLPTSIPAYLINVIPELKVNGHTVKEGSAMRLGEELAFTTIINYRNYGKVPYTYNVAAGSYLSIAAVGGNISQLVLDRLKDRLQETKIILESNNATEIGMLTRQEILGDLFYAGTLGYYAQLTALADAIGYPQNYISYLAAGYGSFGYEPNVDYFFGVPRALKTGGTIFNVPMLRVLGSDNSSNQKYIYDNLQVGVLSSVLEHVVTESLFNIGANNSITEAISAVKALYKAAMSGQKIYHITSENKNNVLANLNHDLQTMDEINTALSAGKEVITHTDAVQVPGWSGAGYIIFDPSTGDGAYKIGGGVNGAFVTAAMFVIAGIAAIHLGGILGIAILLWEIINLIKWYKDIYSAKSEQEINQMTALAFLKAFLGTLPFIEIAVFEAVAVQWFGVFFMFLFGLAI